MGRVPRGVPELSVLYAPSRTTCWAPRRSWRGGSSPADRDDLPILSGTELDQKGMYYKWQMIFSIETEPETAVACQCQRVGGFGAGGSSRLISWLVSASRR